MRAMGAKLTGLSLTPASLLASWEWSAAIEGEDEDWLTMVLVRGVVTGTRELLCDGGGGGDNW